MKQFLILQAITIFMKMLTPELMKKFITNVREKIETRIKESATTVDDMLLKAMQGGSGEIAIFGDAILDFCEDYVLGTKSLIDDRIVLPLCENIRMITNIPDND